MAVSWFIQIPTFVVISLLKKRGFDFNSINELVQKSLNNSLAILIWFCLVKNFF
jgi:hypothetical protein